MEETRALVHCLNFTRLYVYFVNDGLTSDQSIYDKLVCKLNGAACFVFLLVMLFNLEPGN